MQDADFFKIKFKKLFDAYLATGTGRSQSSFAKDAGVKQSQVSTWLRGGYLPGYDGLLALSRFFKVPVAEFFPPVAEAKPSPKAVPSPRSVLFGDIVDTLTALQDSQLKQVLGFIQLLIEGIDDDDIAPDGGDEDLEPERAPVNLQKKAHRPR